MEQELSRGSVFYWPFLLLAVKASCPAIEACSRFFGSALFANIYVKFAELFEVNFRG